MLQTLPQRPRPELSPYRMFTREEWAKLRADTPMTLSGEDLAKLSGVIERISVEEVVDIYLPMSRLLNLYVHAAQALHADTSSFLGRRESKVPFIIGMAGSVAVGKSTTARVLRVYHQVPSPSRANSTASGRGSSFTPHSRSGCERQA